MNQPLISIVVPVYNTAAYLEKCIDSILNQTYKNLEIILVDDGSTDNSGNICDEYKAKDNRVIVIHQANSGVSSARNIALDIAKGEYISFVDSDDWIEADMYKELLQQLLVEESDIAMCGYYYDDGSVIEKKDFCYKSIHLTNEEAMAACLSRKNNMFCAVWATLIRKKLFDQVYFPTDIFVKEDAVTLMAVMKNANNVVYMSRKFYHYVQNNNSALHKRNTRYWTFLKAHDVLTDILKNNSKMVKDALSKSVIRYDIRNAIEASDNGNLVDELYRRLYKNMRKHFRLSVIFSLKINILIWTCLFFEGRNIFNLSRKIRRMFISNNKVL